MQASAAFDSQLSMRLNELMAELHELVSKLQMPKPKSESWKKAMLDRCEAANGRIKEIIAEIRRIIETINASVSNMTEAAAKSWAEKHSSLSESLEEIGDKISGCADELSDSPNVRKLKAMYQSLCECYEELVVEIKSLKEEGLLQTAKASHIKPVNYARNIFHISMGVGSAALYEFVLTKNQALIVMGILLAIFGTLEITRRFSSRWNDYLVDKVFGLISRPHERGQTNGATWFLIALFVIVLIFPKKVDLAAVLILGLADPAASICGKLWGRKKLLGEKSYVGSLVFLIVAFLIALPFAISGHSVLYGVFAAFIIALAGALTELLITKIDDNFTIPVVCATVGYFLIHLV